MGSPSAERQNSYRKLCRSSCQRTCSSLCFSHGSCNQFVSGLKQSRGAMFGTPLVRSFRTCARAFITVVRPGFLCKAAAAITSTVFFVRSSVESSQFVLAPQGSNIFNNFSVATSSTSSTQQHLQHLQHLHPNSIFNIATFSK